MTDVAEENDDMAYGAPDVETVGGEPSVDSNGALWISAGLKFWVLLYLIT